ncbi:MAG: MBL fold metallo-hydrolase [Gammaproteobacteria bacterium]|nr:MBL fold metallo-hydrolase [Gammaproteobacteria bacterium]
MQLSFYGATQTVTGSKYLLTCGKRKVLVDCGLFQGYKHLRLKNWALPPFDPKQLDAVVLTHAHIDHSGYLPRLMNGGFKGPIYATEATTALCKILLPDSGFLQEEQARFANRYGFSKHHPALPLYTRADAERCLRQFVSVDFDQPVEVARNVHASFHPSGHLLGAASVRIEHEGTSIVFSGDIGRSADPLMKAPGPVPPADYVVIESTYGDRTHAELDPLVELERALARAIADDGIVIVPTFAVGRAQLLMLLIHRLKRAGKFTNIPVFLDSPMAIDATDLYLCFASEHRVSPEECRAMCQGVTYVRTPEQSQALDQLRSAAIILASSGMATGGRVVHHLKVFAPDARNMILLSGYQAGGTRGAALAAGAKTVRIHGQEIAVRAEVAQLTSLSAHADADELMVWLRRFPRPKRVFVTHGEPNASDAIRRRIESELNAKVVVPDYRDRVEL